MSLRAIDCICMTASMDTCEGCAEMGAVPPCERSHWGPRWSSLWGHETCEGCAEIGAVGKGKDEEEGEGGGAAGGGGERGALSLQNEDPTPQDGWEKTTSKVRHI